MQHYGFIKHSERPPLTLHCGGSGEICFSVIKADAQTGQRLSGAVFSLTDSKGCTQQRETDADGVACFAVRPGCVYFLQETSPPRGYIRRVRKYCICIDSNGCLRMNGCCYCPCLMIYNCKSGFCIKLRKTDSFTGEGLPGAVFELRRDNVTAYTAISGKGGELCFTDVTAGEYLLAEVTPPPGYLPDDKVYTVNISSAGNVLINGAPTEGFSLVNVRAFYLQFRKVSG